MAILFGFLLSFLSADGFSTPSGKRVNRISYSFPLFAGMEEYGVPVR